MPTSRGHGTQCRTCNAGWLARTSLRGAAIYRGGSGRRRATTSATVNVRWRVELPERGNSSQVVWGDRVFVAQAISGEHRRTVMCFARSDGKLLWQSGATYTDYEPTQPNNPYCSATPVTDGRRVIASFGSAGLYCYDIDSGKELWHRDLGKMSHMHGNASSPILFGELCVLNFGPDAKARLVAVNRFTGQIAWEADPPKVDPSERQMRGPGGFAGPGGPAGPGRGFGPGGFLAQQILSQADKNGDQKISKDELTALADTWFDKLDPDKTGKVSREQFSERFGEVLGPPRGFGPPDGGPRPDDGPPGPAVPGPQCSWPATKSTCPISPATSLSFEPLQSSSCSPPTRFENQPTPRWPRPTDSCFCAPAPRCGALGGSESKPSLMALTPYSEESAANSRCPTFRTTTPHSLLR